MPTKKTTKSDSKVSKKSDKKEVSKVENKKDTTKKVVVKRRKSDLKPTKASAVAIASQASRAKQALIEKVASSDIPYRKPESSDAKIPLWVWMFFGCSLLLFCISFYKAIIYPQLDWWNVGEDENIEFLMDWDENNNETEVSQELDIPQNVDVQDVDISDDLDGNDVEEDWAYVPATPIETIEVYFSRLSDRDFDGAFQLMLPALKNTSEIRDHFTSFRMNPFLDWIQWWRIIPTNFEYANSPAFWKDVYKFDLSYVMISDQTRYDETWEFTVNTKWDEPKISSIRCVTPKCSYHPIFWPENFGLMR